MTANTGDMRLGRTRGMATALTAATVAIGVIIALRGFRGSPAAIVLGAFLVVAGVLAYSRALRPWLLDEHGLSLAGNRRLLWSDVQRIQVIATTPKGAGRGMARVELIIHSRDRKARLVLMSRKDAARVAALLQDRLPANVKGRDTLWLIDNAWAHIQ
ncbi:MAG: hypothetical protein FJW85_05580 [Actinobacteria bacterium]|nr:hypothetical protein [Actinomycetota bacterium]